MGAAHMVSILLGSLLLLQAAFPSVLPKFILSSATALHPRASSTSPSFTLSALQYPHIHPELPAASVEASPDLQPGWWPISC